MDGQNTDAGRTSPRSRAASSAEPHPDGKGPAAGEHADSPVRKRMRLDSSVGRMEENTIITNSPSTPSSSKSTSADGGQTTPSAHHTDVEPAVAMTPSKVTLNLRHSNPSVRSRSSSSSVDLSTDRTIDDLDGHSRESKHTADSQRSPHTVDLTTTSSVTSSTVGSAHDSNGYGASPADSPVVEIAVDDSDGIDDNYPGLVDVIDASSYDAAILSRFPYAREFGAADAARRIADDFVNSDVSVGVIAGLTKWLEEWLIETEDSKTDWHDIFLNNDEFWQALATLVNKLLSRRTILEPLSIRSNENIRVRSIRDFLSFYIRVCAQSVLVDIGLLLNSSTNSNVPSLHPTSLCHLKNLDRMLKTKECPLWSLLRTKYNVETEKIQQLLVAQFLSSHCDDMKLIIRLTTLTAQQIYTWPVLSNLLLSGIKNLCNVSNQLVKMIHLDMSSDRATMLVDFAGRVLTLIRHVEHSLLENVSKQPSSTPIDFNRQMVDKLGETLEAVVRLDTIGIATAATEECPDLLDAIPEDYPQIIRNSLVYRMLWRFVAKGRMELRVLGVDRMQADLVNLWTEYNPKQEGQAVLRSVANMLAREKVMEYIVSVDSHPQIVSRSKDIAGFLLVNRLWTQDMTNTIWSTIESSQDPRLVAATLEMLSGALNTCGTVELIAFCQKLNHLPFAAFSSEMLSFCRTLFDSKQLVNTGSSFEDRQIPYRLCMRLIRDAFTESVMNGNNTYARYALDTANFMHEQMSRFVLDFSDRKQLYVECIDDVKSHNDRSAAGLEALRMLLSKNSSQDFSIVANEMNLLNVVAEEFCHFGNAQQLGLSTQYDLFGLSTRLHLLDLLLPHPAVPSLPQSLEQKLWTHLVGQDSIDESSREEAWSRLCHIVASNERKFPFIERCIDQYLSLVESNSLSRGFYNFVEAAMSYRQRIDPPSTPDANTIIKIPLADQLWRIILTAPHDSVVLLAAQLLSQQHLDSPLVKRAPPTSVTATHAALVERCIDQLKTAASRLKRNVYNTTRDGDELMSGVVTEEEAHRAELQFTRTLSFLRTFLADVKSRPMISTSAQTGSVDRDQTLPASPEIPIEGDPVKFVYQTFHYGTQTETREIIVGKRATLGGLAARLRRRTGSCALQFIVGGRIVDFEHEPHRLVETLPKGNVIVRNLQGDENTSKDATFTTTSSTAETTLLGDFHTLYEFLDLQPHLSQAVFSFLRDFPSHDSVRDLVFQGLTALSELFPEGKDFKALYSLHSMKTYLSQEESGSVRTSFIEHGIKVLAAALVDDRILRLSFDTLEDWQVTLDLINTFSNFLNELDPSTDGILDNGIAVVDKFIRILKMMKEDSRPQSSATAAQVYTTLVETSRFERQVWIQLKDREDVLAIHHWLLLHDDEHVREAVASGIAHLCQMPSISVRSGAYETLEFFWSVTSSAIPNSRIVPKNSKQLFQVALTIYQANESLQKDENSVKEYLSTWGELLRSHSYCDTAGSEEVDEFLFGITRLLQLCLSTLRLLKTPGHGLDLVEVIFAKFLFPPILDENRDSAGSFSAVQATEIPVCDTQTRKELYQLVLGFCTNSTIVSRVVSWISVFMETEKRVDSLLWNTDRTRLLRAPAGYVGLRNLTNTCYMNSLVAQLFMNSNFRRFMLEANVADANGSQRLLSQTQALFMQMQNGNTKYADTGRFAQSVQPYDTDQIDVSIQMDVDEFYNLLFDRWEGQMLTSEAKQQFRSFYGGQSVNQIKSRDCSHISERLEPFMTIQCDVKGKANLADSLQAFVEGDIMTGDNKYKCESCGGKFVNAVKRSCFKEIPNSLIFHLKRFDFDLSTLQRCKINDRFDFPTEIDMREYKVDYLNDPNGQYPKDVFELVGVLVHNGTAETGHYYSYVRAQKGQTQALTSWIEFNDTEVNTFDYSKIPANAFGGYLETNDNTFGWQKPFNAYMLFYERKEHINTLRSEQGDSSNNSSIEIRNNVERSNQLTVRRYCLLASSHTKFITQLLPILKNLNDCKCSKTHELEDQILTISMDHIDKFVSRAKEFPDLENALIAIKNATTGCIHCSASVLNWIIGNPQAAQNMLLYSPTSKIRHLFGDFIVNVLWELRKNVAGQNYAFYGFNPDPSDMEDSLCETDAGAFPGITDLLKDMIPHLGRHIRAWPEFFHLLTRLAQLGPCEVGCMLADGIFSDCLEILMMEKHIPVDRSRHLLSVYEACIRLKRAPNMQQLVVLIGIFLQYIDVHGEPVDDFAEQARMGYPGLQKWPLTIADRRLIMLYQQESRQYWFVTKCIDSSDHTFAMLSSTHWPPNTIMKALMADNPSLLFLERLSNTFSNGIKEYEPAYTRPIIKTALTFCRLCNEPKFVTAILKAVAQNTMHLEIVGQGRKTLHGSLAEMEVQGAQAHLDFFWELAEIRRTPKAESETDDESDESDEQPWLSFIIRWAPTWGSHMLLYDDKTTRYNTLLWLNKLIFDHLSQTDEQDNSIVENVSVMDNIRLDVVYKLFDECRQQFIQAYGSRVLRSCVSPLMDVLTACASCLKRAKSVEDYDTSVSPKWHDVCTKWQLWQEADGDEPFTETEYASNFEDESDELTEA